MKLRLLAWVALILLAGCASGKTRQTEVPLSASGSVRVGPDMYHTVAPLQARIAVDVTLKTARPRIAKGAPGGVVSNDWWSSLIYPLDPTSLDSLPLYAHPLVFQTHASGVGVSYPNSPEVLSRQYMYPYREDLLVGLQGFTASELEVTAHSDFLVQFDLRSEGDALAVTMGHGLPYLQLTKRSDRDASVHLFSENVRVVRAEGGSVVVDVAGRLYGLFAPKGSWQRTKEGFSSDLGGKSHFSVAALPDASETTIRLFEKHAFAFADKSSVKWQVSGTDIETEYSVQSTLVEPCTESQSEQTCERSPQALLALYPHQWGNSSDETIANLTFASPRGQMKISDQGRFMTQLRAFGLLPRPPLAEEDRGRVRRQLRRDSRAPLFPVGLGETPAHDAYWDGKSLGRIATLVQIADATGEDEIKEELLSALRDRLSDWFDGQAPRYFYYDKTWRSLMAFPESYGSASHINDHNFHYGYFVHAAATVAQFDPKWALSHKPFIDLLIRDVAATKENDELFPRLRSFDPYAGHSWANGPAQFMDGNNEESSSEDVNFSWAVALWGALTGDRQLEELGLYLYATEVSTVEEYWFDVHGRVFPEGFAHPTVAMVWGAGGKYDTWFDQDPAMIHGINFLPLTGGSYYLGRHPAYVEKNFQVMLKRSHGEITTWRDPVLMFRALSDPEDAMKLYKQDRFFRPEFGASRSMTLLWLSSLVRFGLPDFEIPEASPFALTFKSEGKKTKVVFDPKKRTTTQSVAR